MPQGSISTAGMKSMARASGVTLKQKEAAEEEKKKGEEGGNLFLLSCSWAR